VKDKDFAAQLAESKLREEVKRTTGFEVPRRCPACGGGLDVRRARGSGVLVRCTAGCDRPDERTARQHLLDAGAPALPGFE
jgi:hypothetical protein